MYTVWSPFDGEPIPAPNVTERDILLSQGYLAEPPEPALATGEPGPELGELPPGAESDAKPDKR